MPVPLARCAFLRRSSGTSTVILRAVSMPFYTILETSIEYGISCSDKPAERVRTRILLLAWLWRCIATRLRSPRPPALSAGGLKPEIVARVWETRPGCCRAVVVNDHAAADLGRPGVATLRNTQGLHRATTTTST